MLQVGNEKPDTSQRQLAGRLDVSLSKTNFLIELLLEKSLDQGWQLSRVSTSTFSLRKGVGKNRGVREESNRSPAIAHVMHLLSLTLP